MGGRGVRLAIPLIAAALVAALPFVVTNSFLLKVFTYVGLNVIVVTGLALLFGYAGQVSLGHAAFVGLGAYTCAIVSVKLHAPWPVAFAAAGAVAAVGGLVLALPSLRLKGHYLAMATLGFGELMSLAFTEATPLTGGVDGFSGIPFPTVGAFEIRTPAGCWRPTLSHSGPAERCAHSTAASLARPRAAWTSWASRCARSWSRPRSPGCRARSTRASWDSSRRASSRLRHR